MNRRGFTIDLKMPSRSMGSRCRKRGCRSAQGHTSQTVVDYVHGVAQADRAGDTTDIVERMRGFVVASEHLREAATLPLPAQL